MRACRLASVESCGKHPKVLELTPRHLLYFTTLHSLPAYPMRMHMSVPVLPGSSWSM